MRAALHVIATVVLLPYIALAAGFLLLGQAISRGSLLSILDALLSQFLWIVPWGAIGMAVAIFLVAALGLSPGSRWLGGACLFVIAAACLVIIVVMPTAPMSPGQWLFLLPCALVLLFGGWLCRVEWLARP